MSTAETLYPAAEAPAKPAEPATPAAPASNPEAPAPAAPEKTPDAVPAEAAPAKVEEKPAEESKDKPAEAKPDEKAPDAKPPVVPDKYDLKLPEGSLLHASHVAKIATEAKADGLSQEQAQARLNRDSQLKADLQSDLLAEHNKQADTWAESSKADQEIGGANHPRAVELSKRFIDRFATPEFKEMLNASRYGDHPEMVRMIWRAAKTMSEDTMVLPGAQGSTAKKSTADVLYGDTVAKE